MKVAISNQMNWEKKKLTESGAYNFKVFDGVIVISPVWEGKEGERGGNEEESYS